MRRFVAVRLFFANTYDFDLYAAVQSTALTSRIGCDGVSHTFAFGVDQVSRDTLAYEVVFNRIGTTLRKLQVVGCRTSGVRVTGSQDGFEVHTADFLSNLVEYLFAFGFQVGLVKVKEGVGVEYDLGRYGLDYCYLFDCLRHAITTRVTSGWCPERVTPAQFTCAITPNIPKGVLPVVHCASLSRHSTRGCGCREGECKCDFGGFIHVSPR